MQAVILAGGKSTRMQPLGLPKPLLPLLGSSLLAHNLAQLRGIAHEIILVVNHKQELFPRHPSLRIVDQKESLGTAHALQAARPFLKGRFLVLNGDDLYHHADLKTLTPFSILVSRVTHPERYGVIATHGDKVSDLIEKPDDPPSDLANAGAYMLDTTIFDTTLQASKRGEYEITDYLLPLIRQRKLRYHAVNRYWLPIGYPWQLLEAQEFFFKRLRARIKGHVERRATIKGPVRIEKGTCIKDGAYIEGPVYIGRDCSIGPNCHIRAGTVMGENVKVGNACEIKNSLLFSRASVGHLSYVGDSIVGTDANLGAGTITANLRHDDKEIKTLVKGILCNTGRRKFGAVIADNVKTGIGTKLYPGVKIWPSQWTLPNEVIKEDKQCAE
ncbi:MAG: bifunctional sugar-1-phosphate nucleotidylyltransferase/acetyltransferase [Nanobdellota archaeon]